MDPLAKVHDTKASLAGQNICCTFFADQYSMKNYLAPKLSPSCVSYRDLFINTHTGRVSKSS